MVLSERKQSNYYLLWKIRTHRRCTAPRHQFSNLTCRMYDISSPPIVLVISNLNLSSKNKKQYFAHSQGDSGGPLMATTTDGRALQVGVTSYGPNCHRAEWTGVYTSVDAFAEWIGFYIADQSQYTWLKLPQGGPGEV